MRGPNVVYVGNLPNDIKEREIQELFDKVCAQERTADDGGVVSRVLLSPTAALLVSCAQFGGIRAIDIKIPPRPPPFAFVEFEDPR
jgi:RNA recognition motif-containing protein